MTKVYKLPSKFYFDHKYRDCASGKILKETKQYVMVELDREAYDDLLSDADYYSDNVFGPEYRGLVYSARATYRKLKGDPFNFKPADGSAGPKGLADMFRF